MNTATIAEDDNKVKVIKITFEYDLQMIDNIRSLPGRKYYADSKCWSAPIYPDNIEKLKLWKFTIDPRLNDYLLKNDEKTKEIVAKGIPNLKGELRPFQKIGVAFIESKNGRALVADDMGLGKTIEALSFIQIHREKTPVTVICPASLKLNWEEETAKWLPDPDIELLSGERPWKTEGNFLILNYDIAFAWIEELKRRKIQILILDEAHKIKSNKARRTKSVKIIAKGIPYLLGLTGTPIENRPIEIYNIWKLIDPTNCPAWNYFIYRFCNAKNNGFGLDVNGASNISELHTLLKNSVMIRRLKRDVLKELPGKTFSFIPMELNNTKEYKEAERSFIDYIRQTQGDEVAEKLRRVEQLARIEGLKQLAVKGKLNQVIEWVKDFLETGNKLVVFTSHHFTIDALSEAFPTGTVMFDGRCTDLQKQQAKNDFQNNDEIRLFLGNLKSAGEGITLTASSNVAIIELPWSPKTIDQAGDRVDRIGQKFAVNIYYLLAKNTIEEKIARLLDQRRKMTDGIVDGKETEQESLLGELMKEYK